MFYAFPCIFCQKKEVNMANLNLNKLQYEILVHSQNNALDFAFLNSLDNTCV